MTAIELRRARNMHRFYRLDIEPDLFRGALLMKASGRIGTRRRAVAACCDNKDTVLAALQKSAERKKRRGYLAKPENIA